MKAKTTRSTVKDAQCSHPVQLVAVTLAVFAAVVALGAVSASAALVHPLISSFSGSEENFAPWGVAVDNSAGTSAGDVYVSDQLHALIDKFSGSGEYRCQITGAGNLSSSLSECDTSTAGVPGGFSAGVGKGQGSVDANGNLYVPDPSAHLVDEFNSAGAYLSQIEVPGEGEPFEVAVAASNTVFIADAKNYVVKSFDPVTKTIATFASETPSGHLGEVWGVAVDNDPASSAHGDVYVVDRSNGAVDVYNAAGEYLSQLTSTPSGPFSAVFRVAVDPSTGDLYVAAVSAIDEFSPTGAFLTETRIPEGGGTLSVAVAGATGDFYAGDPINHRVDVFGPAVTVPDVTTGTASNIELTNVTVQGKVDPAGGGEVTSCTIEYGTTTSYGKTQPCSPATPYTSPTEISTALNGLTPSTLYHFRVSANNANGVKSYGEDGTFETTGPPTADEESVTGITRTSATLQAQVNPHGLETTYHFEYGPTASYGASVPAPDGNAGAGTTDVTVSAEITGLTLDTTYHYRLVATNSAGTVDGSDITFTTLPVARVENLYWLAGPHEATLKAKVEDFGAQSACEVEYVSETEFASTGYTNPTIMECTPEQLTASEGGVGAIVRLNGLDANTTYHFRFLVSNQYGELHGQDQTVTTFGIFAFSLEDTEQEGHPYTQAGGHPYELTTHIVLNQNADHLAYGGPGGNVKDISVHLPAGLIGDPQATAKCTRYEAEKKECSGASQVGIIEVQDGPIGRPAPLFNIVPPRGVAAEFSARINNFANAFIDAGVRTGSDYGIDADSLNITSLATVMAVRVTIWGVPADPRHDPERSCVPPGYHNTYETPCSIHAAEHAFLTNPTSCMGPLTATALADAYQAPGEFAELGAEIPAITGCERLHFSPTIEVRPEASAADSPTGLHVDLHVPQEESASGLAEADLKGATVTLPTGMAVNPASAGGLTACSEAQIELHGPLPATCPDSSKVGTVELVSPLIDHPLDGAVYVAQQGNGGSAQGSNPFGSLLALYVAIDDPQTGVVVKLAGKVTLDQETGQLTTTFDENPQLPFEDLKLDFFGGPRAALATPSVCGSSAASASLTSWAEPSAGVNPVVQPFSITSGPGGSPCPAGAFAPMFTAGTHSAQAGAFAPFVLSFSRQDGEPGMSGLEATLSPGLLAKLAGIPLCGSTEAAAGTCPAASQIGTVTAGAGAGPQPIVVQGGVYLTGPYNGGPFGEVVEVPAVAGPFNLGTVVVRGAIRINPYTAQATVVSDPFPTMLQGVPLHLKRVAVTLDRPGFMLNPTNCNQLAITGTITDEHGASASVSAPFQVSNCATLPFKPSFAVSTQARSSKAGGASLRVRIAPGAGANLAKIKVDLPRQLPSRLSTLQKACLAAVFATNPAACPAGSVVGSARAVTPLLTTPFTGSAYLVSHGGAAFPDLEIVLQSEGITLIEDGKTNIKNGVTSSTFKAIPDAPLALFELVLPEGPHSALSAFLPPKAKGSMCGQRLLMPTQITGQNGAVIKQTTKIAVTGCPKHRKAKAGRTRKKKR